MLRVFSIPLDCEFCLPLLWDDGADGSSRFAPLLQKKGSIEDPSRVIITASVAGIGVGTLGKNATFGYSASKAAVIRESSVQLFSFTPFQSYARYKYWNQNFWNVSSLGRSFIAGQKHECIERFNMIKEELVRHEVS